MITERAVLNLLRVDTYDEDTELWVPWAAELNSFEIVRGGKRSGVKTTVEPGTLTATLVNAANPVTDARIRPNVPIRVVTPYTSQDEFDAVYAGMDQDDFDALWDGQTQGQFDAAFTPLYEVFTGSVLDIFSKFSFDKQLNEKTRLVTITATDAVRAHVATPRAGAVAGLPNYYETWAQRIQRLSSSSSTEVQPPADDTPIVRYSL